MIDNEVQLFFFLYINDFVEILQQGALRISSSIAFETVKSQREERQNRDDFFHF